jgi:hypothetical protein
MSCKRKREMKPHTKLNYVAPLQILLHGPMTVNSGQSNTRSVLWVFLFNFELNIMICMGVHCGAGTSFSTETCNTRVMPGRTRNKL